MKTKTARHNLDLNFSTTIHLHPGDNKRFQLLYFTQLYDTLFSLFARFEVEETQVANASKRIKEIEFLGVNYKGEKNLKIEDIKVGVEQTISDDGQAKLDLLKVDLTVSGCGTGTYTRPKDKIMQLSLDVPDDASLRVQRTLRSMNNFEHRIIQDGFEGFNLPEDAYWNGSFDSEFFIRDGFFISPKSASGKLFKFNPEIHLQNYKTGDMVDKNSLPFASSINCPIGVGLINPDC